MFSAFRKSLIHGILCEGKTSVNNIGEVNKNGHGECRPNILHWGKIKQWNTREDKQA